MEIVLPPSPPAKKNIYAVESVVVSNSGGLFDSAAFMCI